jgi:hypothetical protein
MRRLNCLIDVLFGGFGYTAPCLFGGGVYAVKSLAVTGILPDAIYEHLIMNAIRHEALLCLAVLMKSIQYVAKAYGQDLLIFSYFSHIMTKM